MDALMTQLQDLWSLAMTQAGTLLLPSRQIQVAIIVLVGLLAWSLSRWIAPRFRAWAAGLEGRPKWQLRILVVLQRRIGLILFTALIWLSAAIMAEVSPFPSRRFLLELVGTITLAILAVGFAARLVRNPVLRSIVKWGLWIYVVLYYLGLVEAFRSLLDNLAIEFGEFRLSALILINALIAVGILITMARLFTQSAVVRVRRNEAISPSMQELIVKLMQVVLYGAAFFIGLKAVGFDLTGLAVLSGAIGVGLGFGLQKVVSNLVSGIIILLDKSVKPGDVISIGETFGWINALGARYVSITTRDGREFLVPNEDLITGQVVNWSHSNDFVRLDIYFGTAYTDDPHEVRRIAIEACSGVSRVLSSRAPVCHIVGFGDSSVDYILRFWITDPTGGLTNIRGNVYLALWDAFQANGISIPFPQREVKLLGGEMPVASQDGEGG